MPADLIVWATGYKVSFPFLDPALIAAKDNDLPLWKRTVHPDLPGLYFIGLLQPVGAVMPLAQAQGEWVAERLAGRYAPPPDAEIRRQMRADHERNRRQFYSSRAAHHGGRLRPLPVGPAPRAAPWLRPGEGAGQHPPLVATVGPAPGAPRRGPRRLR